MHNLESQAVSLFKCNQWLSKTEGDGKLSVEIPAETDGEKALSGNMFCFYCIQVLKECLTTYSEL